ncbi:MAG: glycosyl hydrolase [Edaphocola sp.]
MKKTLLYLLVLLLCPVFFAAAQWPKFTAQTKPFVRWWWMGSAVDSAGIAAEMSQFAAAGFGGVEIVPIYGAKGYEDKYIPYLSPRWVAMLDQVVANARKLDMQVYVSVGSGWPIGGPQVSLADAATKIVLQEYNLSAGSVFSEKIVANDAKQRALPTTQLQVLIAYDETGKALDITDKVGADGILNWQAPKGKYRLIAAFAGKTLQKVKRAASGGEGYTLNHFSAAATNNYLEAFIAAFKHGNRGVAAFYNDSYEVYNADWSPDFFQEFLRRRGYDLKPYLNYLLAKEGDSAARIKSDYRQTMAEMMLHNFTRPFHDWAAKYGASTLNQAHGAPGNLLDLYANVDIPETESFGLSKFDIKGLPYEEKDIYKSDADPVMMKFASSGAHASGGTITSSESFTWLTEHFKTTWAACKPEAEKMFLAGINHLVYHGTTYSPKAAGWPGWTFYASVEFNPNNTLWPQINGMNQYFTRCGAMLQYGVPDNDVLLYWPMFDVWHNAGGWDSALDMPLRIHNLGKWLYGTKFYSTAKELIEKGFQADYVSDLMLSKANVDNEGNIRLNAHTVNGKVILVPPVKYMPLATLSKLVNLAKSGATVVFQDLPFSLPGFHNSAADKAAFAGLVSQLANGRGISKFGKGMLILEKDGVAGLEKAKVYGEQLVQHGLQFIRRKTDDGFIYFIVNHTDRDIDTFVRLNNEGNAVTVLDPLTGGSGGGFTQSAASGTSVRLLISSGYSYFIRLSDKLQEQRPWKYCLRNGSPATLAGKWKVHFAAGGPYLPKDFTTNDGPQLWTSLANGDQGLQNFSGTADYTTTFTLDKSAPEYSLVLNGLFDAAHIWVNGQDAGYVWCYPMDIKVGNFLKNGQNELKIEVSNVMANRIRFMDRKGIVWRNYHEINFVDLRYKPFDAANWDVVPAGLAGPVLLQPLKE